MVVLQPRLVPCPFLIPCPLPRRHCWMMKARIRPPLLPNHPRSPAGGQVKMNIMSEELAGATRDKTISNKPSEE